MLFIPNSTGEGGESITGRKGWEGQNMTVLGPEAGVWVKIHSGAHRSFFSWSREAEPEKLLELVFYPGQ